MKPHLRWAALVCAVLAPLARGQTPPPTTAPPPKAAPTAAPTPTLAASVDLTSPLNIVMPPFVRLAIDYNQDPVDPQKSRWTPIGSAFYPASKGLGVYVGVSLVCTPSILRDSTTGREVRTCDPQPRFVAGKSLWTGANTQVLLFTDIGEGFTDAGSSSGTNLSESIMPSVVHRFSPHWAYDVTARLTKVPATATQRSFWNPEMEVGVILLLGSAPSN